MNFRERKTFTLALRAYDMSGDQMDCGCDRGFCECDEHDGIDPGYDGILGEG